MTLEINISRGSSTLRSPKITPGPTGTRQFVLFQGYQMWQSSATCKAYIDTMLSTLAGYITDIVPLVIQYYVAQYQLWGASTLAHYTSVTIEGHTPLGYCIEQAHARGIKVHAWFVFMYSDAWCGSYSFLLSPQPDTTSYRTADDIILYSVASTRTKMANCLADFYDQNPGLDGIYLDYIRTNANVEQNAADITTLVQLIRNTVDPACTIGFFSLANPQALISNKQDGATWTQNGYVDMTFSMAYEYNWGRRMEYLVDLLSKPYYVGLSPDEAETSQSGFRARMWAAKNRGYPDLGHFQYSSTGIYPGSNALTALKDYVDNKDGPTMGNITRLSMNWTTGGSLSFTIDGVTRTISYATGSGFTNNREWKDYVEGLYGQLPYLFFNPIDTTICRMMYGDEWNSF